MHLRISGNLSRWIPYGIVYAFCLSLLISFIINKDIGFADFFIYCSVVALCLIIIFEAFSSCSLATGAMNLKLCNYSYGYYKLLSEKWGTPIYGFLFYAVLISAYKLTINNYEWLAPIAYKSILLAASINLILIMLWLVLSSWDSPPFRYILFLSSLHVGAAGKWMLSGWRKSAIILIAVMLIAEVRSIMIGVPYNLKNFLNIDFLLSLLVISSLVWLALWVYNVHKKITIMPFDDYTDNQNAKSVISSLDIKLQDTLLQLQKVFSNIEWINNEFPDTKNILMKTNRKYSSKFKMKNIAYNLNIENTDSDIQGVVSASSELSLGFLKIPIGAVIGLVAKLSHGPRLTGSLLKEGGKPILIANMKGNGIQENWRVCFDDLEIEEPNTQIGNGALFSDTSSFYYRESHRDYREEQIILKLTERLAYLIYGELFSIETKSMSALYYYIEGMRYYRDALQTNELDNALLEKSKNMLKKSLSRDKSFGECCYNLGRLYYLQGNPRDGKRYLEKCAQMDFKATECYYFLIKRNIDKKDGISKECDDPQELCARSIQLDPNNPRLWCLKGYIIRKKFGLEEIKMGKFSNEELKKLMDSLHYHEIAVAIAWKQLCFLSIRGATEEIRAIVQNCMLQVSLVYRLVGDPIRSEAAFDQAISLNPRNSDIMFRYGKSLCKVEEWEPAIKLLENASIMDESPIYYAYLAFANSKINEVEKTKCFCKRAMNLRSHLLRDNEMTYYLKKAFENIGEEEEVRRIKHTRSFLKKINDLRNRADLKGLKDLLITYNDWNWAYAQIEIRLAKTFLESYSSQGSREKGEYRGYLEDAISKLEKEHPQEIFQYKLNKMLTEFD
jgi:Tfp pilus assembly protein PilF